MSAPDELWVVIDEDGAPDLAVTYPEAAQEHINDALDTMPEDAADIAKWRSVRYIRADAPKADSAQPGGAVPRGSPVICEFCGCRNYSSLTRKCCQRGEAADAATKANAREDGNG